MEDIEKMLIETDQRCKSNTHRLDKLEDLADAIHIQGENIARMVTELSHTNKNLEDLSARVGSLEKKPVALWDKLIGGSIGACATGLAAAILASILR